jgi:inhibitor of KinA
MPVLPVYKIFPLGDSAITIDFGNIIDETINQSVISVSHYLNANPVPGMIEVVPACSSLTVYYDLIQLGKKIVPEKTGFDWIKEKIENLLKKEISVVNREERTVLIPVCYDHEFGVDLNFISRQKNIPVEKIIELHTAKTYRVYMLGFLPGFAYMAEVDESITIGRKEQPLNVSAGSVGIAGRQTGIYPFDSPGGWQIIGRTPLNMFDKEAEQPTLLRAGDKVQFYSITKDEFIRKRRSGAEV